MSISESSARKSSPSSSTSEIENTENSEIDNIDNSENDGSAPKIPSRKSKNNDDQKILKIKNEWSETVYKMESHLAEVGRLLTEIKVLLDELKSILEVKSPATLNDLIKSFEVAIKDTNNLKEQLVKVNDTIKNLRIPSFNNNKDAIEILLKIRKKMEKMLSLSKSSSTPIISNRDTPINSDIDGNSDSATEEGEQSDHFIDSDD